MSSSSLPPITNESVTVADGSIAGRSAKRRAEATVTTTPGTELSRYIVLESIGAGGMGVVLRAYDPKLQREVALKQLRADALDEQGAQRMVREAQAMAQLAHPNVVAVYDVEILETTVLLVMELIQGQTLREWLEAETRRPSRILEVFVQAGQGLAAAHAAGLVHRDFKPGNVLVGTDGRVRVTDFGLARATTEFEGPPSRASYDSLPTSATSHDSLRAPMTMAGTVMGTPAYMAPEQYVGEDADAAADQFAFCVALWEALHGGRPYVGEYRKVAKAKLKGPPPWPRDSAVPRVVGDAIVRGLAPGSADRWPSMEPLLDVLHRDPRQGRQRWVTGAAVGVAALATVGAIVSWTGREPQPCTGASEHMSATWAPARRDAVKAAFEATGVSYAAASASKASDQLDDYAEGWVSMHTETCEATAIRREQSSEVLDLRMACLDRARVRLDATLEVLEDADEAVVERSVALTSALSPLSRCADVEVLRADVPPPEDPARAEAVALARKTMARALVQDDAGRDQAALDALDTIDDAALAYEPLQAELASLRGHILLDLARYEEAERLMADAYPVALRIDARRTAIELATTLAFVLGTRLMREAEATWLGRTALAMAEQRGDERMVAVVLNDIAGVLDIQGKPAEALALFERVLEIQRRVLGRVDPAVANTLANMALTTRNTGDFERAFALRTEELQLNREMYGDEHPAIGRSLHAMGNLLHQRGEYDASVDHLERALAMRERVLGPDHPDTSHTMSSLGLALSAQGRHAEAEQHIRRSFEILERQVGMQNLEVTDGLNNLAIVVEAQGRYEESLALHRRSLAATEALLGPDNPRTATGLNNVGGGLVSLHRYEEAMPLLERAIAIMKDKLGPEHPHVSIFELNLGEALRGLGRYEEAEAVLRHALPIMEGAFGPDHEYTSYVLVALGQVLHARGGSRDAILDMLERSMKIRNDESTPPPKRAEAAMALARVLWEDPAERPRARSLAGKARDWYAISGPGHVADTQTARTWLTEHPAP